MALALLNTENKPKSIGYMSPLLGSVLPQKIVKFDVESEEIIRDPNTGFCIECAAGEKGEFIAKIITTRSGASNYSGWGKHMFGS